MKTIGLIGGMSWESTALYYKLINEGVNARLGKAHSAKILLASLDFEEIVQVQQAGDWVKAGAMLQEAALNLKAGGANCLVLCTNTMHKVAPLQAGLPLLHIADCTAAEIKKHAIKKIGLLATRYTMEQDFYKGKLLEQGIECIIPDDKEREEVHRIIYDELCKGIILERSKAIYLEIMRSLEVRGAQGFILGCTEIGLLISQADSQKPIFDTTLLHAKAAVEWALQRA